MNMYGEPWITRHTHYYSDPDAGPDALLNDATEWLAYAHVSLQFLSERVHERGGADARRLPIMLDGIAALIDMGARCAAQAHLRMQWEQVRDAAEHPGEESSDVVCDGVDN
ncbi:hypothetical protein FHW84_003059 [Dyella sp. SG562]|uniref:hypothetical protein n=1 Tax=Dyella TaxID=231454 RepID=UPI00142378CF|nr:hypothetical protein [Dyella sp. SG562]NII74469.1 hypothetical protein [Dyella sp. SG562]